MSFRFKQFFVDDSNCAMKVGTDGVLLGCFVNFELGVRNLELPCDSRDAQPNSKFKIQNSKFSCLDIGTGSGLVALMVAQQLPDAQILGIDIDPAAAQQAATNFAASPWPNRLTAKHTSLQELSIINYQFSIIFSNPPFFENSLKTPNVQRTIARHTDTLPIDYLFLTAAELLADDGHFFVILPYDQSLPIIPELQLITRLSVRGHAHKPFKRQLLHYTKSRNPEIKKSRNQEITLQDANNHRTPEYQSFAQDFYL